MEKPSHDQSVKICFAVSAKGILDSYFHENDHENPITTEYPDEV